MCLTLGCIAKGVRDIGRTTGLINTMGGVSQQRDEATSTVLQGQTRKVKIEIHCLHVQCLLTPCLDYRAAELDALLSSLSAGTTPSRTRRLAKDPQFLARHVVEQLMPPRHSVEALTPAHPLPLDGRIRLQVCLPSFDAGR